MKALIIGGSGALSGKLAALAKETYEVWALTRGNLPIGEGITQLLADRNDKEAFRAGHIYGLGFLLGCYPEHSRQATLPDLIQSGQPLSLVAGGIYVTQPIFVGDLANTMLDCVDKKASFNIAS